MHQSFLNQSRGILGGRNVLTDAATDAYCIDWRKRYHASTIAVLQPATTDEVSKIVRLCAQFNIAIVPQGGNTGLVGGGVPISNKANVILSLKRLQTIRNIDVDNYTMTLEAGCILKQAQQAAQEVGCLFPLSMASEGSCTIGGNLAVNAGGTQVLRYGNARSLCLGLEVVTANGEILEDLHGLRKNNTGYNLSHLIIGSEGTLGIITAATVKLYPQPKNCTTTWLSVKNVEVAVQLLKLAQQYLGSSLTAFEMMQTYPIQLVAKYFPKLSIPNLAQFDNSCYVLLESSDQYDSSQARYRIEDFLQTALQQELIIDAVMAESLTQVQNLWHIRESIPLAQAQEGLNVKHDIGLPISRISEFLHVSQIMLEKNFPGTRIICFGHLGDGNLHYNVQSPNNVSAAVFLEKHEAAINRLVYDLVYKYGGTISAEHGIGQLKVYDLELYKSPVALQMMRSIKQALDPANILNPSRIIRYKQN